jgi:beta-1,2-mannobiose phosphorylase / 1,2-beta-oligomannan phosphorylase
MMVVRVDSLYYMFAEGKNDIAHWMTSKDRVHWSEHGPLDIRHVNNEKLSAGPYGTPTVWQENSLWYLFYERNDEGIWLATSADLKKWVNVQDEPVIRKGPETYDKFGLALNQIIKHDGLYYGYYHGTAFEDWHEWSTNVAASPDLIHWIKYPSNPIMGDNKSSGILVNDGLRYRLYTMHPQVAVHFRDQNH